MNDYLPEGSLLGEQTNRNVFSGLSSIRDAMNRQVLLEARALVCDREHNLHVELGGMKGIIPRKEGAMGLESGSVRDIALISRVGKPVCFVITALKRNAEGQLYAELSRRLAQERCSAEYISQLTPGDVITARVSHMESFGAFCDIGAGISALLPIDSVSVSRIPHPSVRFFNGQEIKAVVKSIDEAGRVTLSHKELLGTWQENASAFSVGETVPGIIRSVESYGIFAELTPNLAGLAEYNPNVSEGQSAAVYIKSIIPERRKIKLVIVDSGNEKPVCGRMHYYFNGSHMDSFRYSPEECEKITETVFGNTSESAAGKNNI